MLPNVLKTFSDKPRLCLGLWDALYSGTAEQGVGGGRGARAPPPPIFTRKIYKKKCLVPPKSSH